MDSPDGIPAQDDLGDDAPSRGGGPAAGRLLLVDDDPKYQRYAARGLEHSGYACTAAGDAEEAARVIAGHAVGFFDLILLDIMLPGDSGWDVLDTLRDRGDATPVIFVSSCDTLDDRVKGLELGADDYIVKPFAFRELLARVQAVLRRRDAMPTLEIADLVIDTGSRRVTRGGRLLDLTVKEYEVLMVLARARGACVTHMDLLRQVWNLDFHPETNVVNVIVYRLRGKVDAVGAPLIHTERGKGYRMTAPDTEA